MYAHDGALLYIGLTNSPKSRVLNHAADKPWWGEVANIALEHFATRAELQEAERAAILSELPKYNQTFARYSAAWCEAEGHEDHPRGKRCEDCADAAEREAIDRGWEEADRELSTEFSDDSELSRVARNYFGLLKPGEAPMPLDELRATTTWKNFEGLTVALSTLSSTEPQDGAA